AEKSLEEILAVYLNGIEYDVFDEIQNGYECNCSRERTDRALVSLGKKELTDIYENDENTEMTCQFCGRKYSYTKQEIAKLIKEAKA
ncbi:MAG: Hsp33 family molecular chaperone HslO, partial [Clostridia bacterium]|nr:Hsp33 family molecular chaperone HslO [Clostridia bacterium]